jgi:DNA-binding HxlR family transcriptional regulator
VAVAVAVYRSRCPINLTVELLGDRWSLLIVRDLMFTDRRHFRELLRMDERISSSVLADRLARLVDAGLLTRGEDPTHTQKAIYKLTDAGVDLLPVLAQFGIWGRRHQPASEELSVRAAVFDAGGEPAIAAAQAAVRADHEAQPVRPRRKASR